MISTPLRLLCFAATLAGVVATAPGRAQAQPETVGHRRIVDLEFHPLLSIPDAIGVCLEGFPMRRGLSLIGCASLQVLQSASLNAALIYRFYLSDSPTFTLSLGPGAGAHSIADGPRDWRPIAATVDGFASFEAVWWGETRGFQIQVGGGAMRSVWDKPEGVHFTWLPIVDVTLGVAFRTHGTGPPIPSQGWGR